jgi:hypothetical protein
MFPTLGLGIRYVEYNYSLLVTSTDKFSQWFKFNDHNVTLASKSQVLNEQAFLLFYVIQSLA